MFWQAVYNIFASPLGHEAAAITAATCPLNGDWSSHQLRELDSEGRAVITLHSLQVGKWGILKCKAIIDAKYATLKWEADYWYEFFAIQTTVISCEIEDPLQGSFGSGNSKLSQQEILFHHKSGKAVNRHKNFFHFEDFFYVFIFNIFYRVGSAVVFS